MTCLSFSTFDPLTHYCKPLIHYYFYFFYLYSLICSYLDALDLGLVSQESFGLTVANCLPNTKNKSKYVPGKPIVKITETQLLPWKDGLNALYKFISGNTFPAICHREVFIQVRQCCGHNHDKRQLFAFS
jgi:hypothetical protein